MAKFCFELNPNCIVRKMRQGDSPCPAFNKIECCWQIDWPGLLSCLDEKEREFWKNYLLKNCRGCPVYSLHKEAIDRMLVNLKAA